MNYINYDIKRLKEDLIDYFQSAINPFDADLKGVEEINSLSDDKLIELAKKNGFNLKYYIINDY